MENYFVDEDFKNASIMFRKFISAPPSITQFVSVMSDRHKTHWNNFPQKMNPRFEDNKYIFDFDRNILSNCITFNNICLIIPTNYMKINNVSFTNNAISCFDYSGLDVAQILMLNNELYNKCIHDTYTIIPISEIIMDSKYILMNSDANFKITLSIDKDTQFNNDEKPELYFDSVNLSSHEHNKVKQ